jgi:hypothetical protein
MKDYRTSLAVSFQPAFALRLQRSKRQASGNLVEILES